MWVGDKGEGGWKGNQASHLQRNNGEEVPPKDALSTLDKAPRRSAPRDWKLGIVMVRRRWEWCKLREPMPMMGNTCSLTTCNLEAYQKEKAPLVHTWIVRSSTWSFGGGSYSRRVGSDR